MCGVVGAYNVPHASITLRSMLHALQNRGRDGCGIVTNELIGDDYSFHSHKAEGTVAGVFTGDVLEKLPGKLGIGHTRYATAANSDGIENLQPLFFDVDGTPFAIAHNGNFTNIPELTKSTLKGTPFNSASDTERFLRLTLREHRDHRSLPKSVGRALSKMHGSCSAVMSTSDELLAIRDSSGNRPLFWGKKKRGFVVASETCALDAVDVFDWQEVPAGTIMSFSAKGIRTYPLPPTALHMCVFELLYFGFPTSELYGVPVAQFRHNLGRAMAKHHPVETTLILGVPDSAVEMANGYSTSIRKRGADRGVIMRRHDTGRTFILRGKKMRKKAVSEKFSFNTSLIRNETITLIDDSLVRGTTSLGITKALLKRGAREVHWRIPSPKIIASCLYGINTADSSQLIAAHSSHEEMRDAIKADSLEFLDLPNFQKVIAENGMDWENGCYSCMTGEYW